MDTPHLKGRTAIHGPAVEDEDMLAMIAALASELAAARERIDTLESLLETGGALAPGAVEAFAPTQEAQIRRDALRRGLIARVFRPIRDAARRTAETNERSE